MLDAEDWNVFCDIMLAGRHATIGGVIRTALWRYALHFHQQGLMALPRDAFALKGKSFK